MRAEFNIAIGLTDGHGIKYTIQIKDIDRIEPVKLDNGTEVTRIHLKPIEGRDVMNFLDIPRPIQDVINELNGEPSQEHDVPEMMFQWVEGKNAFMSRGDIAKERAEALFAALKRRPKIPEERELDVSR